MAGLPLHQFESIEQLDDHMSTPSEGVIEALGLCPGAILVLGAAGKMGYHVSCMLQRASVALGRMAPVRTVSRFGSSKARQKFEKAGFEVIAADLSDPIQVQNLAPAENIFFLAGMKFGTAQDPALLHRMNVEMPQLVAAHFPDARIVALSTGCVYSFTPPESGGSTETSETNPPGDYAQSCLGRESAFREAGVRASLIRLNYSIDLRYGVLMDIGRAVLEGRAVNISTGYVNVIWQRDAIAHTIQSLPHACTPPFVINVTGPGILSVRELAEKFGARFDRPVVIEGEESSTAWLSNASHSHEIFGSPEVSVDQMIDWTATWLEQGGETLNKPTHFESRDGNY